VTELINGVFKALVDSNQQQMNAYVDLIRNVSATVEGFQDMNYAPTRARQWLVEQFPASFQIQGADPDADPRDAAEEQQESRVVMVSGASMPSEPALRAALGLTPEESVPSGDPDRALVPLVRRSLARQRQQMLATMVQMGMQRIVIESGKLRASMRFHIDTRSAANAESGSRFDLENKVDASAKFGMGAWGFDAKMTNTIGYVSTEKSQTTEEMNTDLDLDSSVELNFKTDYLPLNRMAGPGQADRISANTINPAEEAKAARDAREKRTESARTKEAADRAQIDKQLDHHGSASAAPKKEPDKAPNPAAQPTKPETPGAAKPATAQTPAAKSDASKASPGTPPAASPPAKPNTPTPAPAPAKT
jgi:hypothetical protein